VHACVAGPVHLFQRIQVGHFLPSHMDFSCHSGPLIKSHLSPYLATKISGMAMETVLP
jgi:hypothetical protein